MLAAIVTRVREPGGGIPLVSAYDPHEAVWNPPMPLLFQWHWRLEDRPLSAGAVRRLLNDTLAGSGLTDASGAPLRFTPHDFRRLFITDAVMHGMPPHIAQLVAGHRDINTTMGYKAVYPEEVITGHRAFIARRRTLRPSEEYRTPSDEEWEEFLGHFERRRVALGECGRSYSTPCIHEHSCLRCPLLRPSPAQRPRITGIRGNLLDRIAEAEREGWHGEAEGLKVSLAGADAKLAQLLKGPPVTMPDSIATALRNHAEGSCCLAAAAELLIAQAWLQRADFTSRFITVHRSPGSGKPMAVINWPAAVTALDTSLPCSGGEQRMLKIIASLADGIPVDLRDTITGLDDRNVQFLITAILRASGKLH